MAGDVLPVAMLTFFCLLSCSQVSILLLLLIPRVLVPSSADRTVANFPCTSKCNCVIAHSVQYSDETTPAVTNEFGVAAFR